MSIWSKLFGRPQLPAADAAAAAVIAAVTDGRPVGDGMENVVTNMGMPRDKRTAGVYGTPPVFNEMQLDNMYGGSWLAGKIIDVPVDDMTRTGWTRQLGDSEDQADAKKVADAEDALAIPTRITRCAKWGRLYGGTLLVPVIRNQRLDQPLVLDSIKPGMLVNFLEYDRFEVTPSTTVDDDPESPNAGLPVSYRERYKGLEIHWSRAIRFPGRAVSPRVRRQQQYWDDSILRRIAEVVMNYDQSENGVASLILEAKVDVLAMKNLAKHLAETNGEAKVQKQIQLALMMKSIWNALVIDAGTGATDSGDKFDHKQVSFANLDKILDRLGQSVAGAADIPMTRLFGMSPGGQNATGDSDNDNYDDHIAALQRTQLKPILKRIDQILIRSVLGAMPPEYELTFNPLTQTDAKEEAEIRKLNAESDTIYIDQGVITENLAARELKARGTYRTMQEDDVEMTNDEIPEPVELPEAPLPGADPADDPQRDAA
jgi:uncharacterized protein